MVWYNTRSGFPRGSAAGTMQEGLETLGFQSKIGAWPSSKLTTMPTIPTTTSSFPSNTAKPSLRTTSRSRLEPSLRKSVSAMISTLKKSAVTATTSICSCRFPQSTVGLTWYVYSRVLRQGNCSSDFLHSKKTSGVESSGVTVFTSPPSASGETGTRSNSMSQSRERRWTLPLNSVYSPRPCLRSYPVGLPRGN